MIVAHHGYGEEIVLYALAGGGGVSALVVWSAFLFRVRQWLRRR